MEKLHEFCDIVGTPKIKPHTNISTTRIAARRNMVYVSFVQCPILNPGSVLHLLKYDIASFSFD